MLVVLRVEIRFSTQPNSNIDFSSFSIREKSQATLNWVVLRIFIPATVEWGRGRITEEENQKVMDYYGKESSKTLTEGRAFTPTLHGH